MLKRYLLKHKYLVAIYMLLTTLCAVLNAIISLNVAPVFDAAEIGDVEKLISMIVGLFFLFMIIRLSEYHAENAAIFATNIIRKEIKHDIFKYLINNDLVDYYDRDSGEYVAVLTNDITVLEEKGLNALKDLFSFIVAVISVSGAMLTLDYRLSLIILIGTIICVCVPIIVQQYTVFGMSRFLNVFDSYMQRLKNLFLSFFMIKNYSVEDPIIERFNKVNSHVEDLKFDAVFRLTFMEAAIGRIAWMIELSVIMVGIIGVIRGSISLSSVIAAYVLAGNLGRPLNSLAGRFNEYKSMRSIEEKIRIARRNIKISNSILDEKINVIPEIKIEGLTLSLNEKTVLNDVSCEFKPGKKYLIIGDNGSGKSTLMRALKKTYRAWSGSITIDGRDIKDFSGKDLAKIISYSNENVPLLDDTVRNNITLFRNVSPDLISQLASEVGLTIDLERNLGDDGFNVSSGEKRKIELMRSLLENPLVMIFDEVISTLDIETAYEIEKLILSLDNHTVIMISNAFSGALLNEYDEILVMDKSRIIARGKHTELMEKSPEYRTLFDLRCGSMLQGIKK